LEGGEELSEIGQLRGCEGCVGCEGCAGFRGRKGGLRKRLDAEGLGGGCVC
jgi:hypothetical protein